MRHTFSADTRKKRFIISFIAENRQPNLTGTCYYALGFADLLKESHNSHGRLSAIRKRSTT